MGWGTNQSTWSMVLFLIFVAPICAAAEAIKYVYKKIRL